MEAIQKIQMAYSDDAIGVTQIKDDKKYNNMKEREYGTYLATARRHCRRIKMQKRDE